MRQESRAYQHTFPNYLILKRFAPKTKEAYLRSVADIATFHNQPAEDLTNDQIQAFLRYIIQEKQLSWSSCNVLFCGLINYYRHFLGRSETEFTIPPRPRSKQLPMLLSREEVSRILTEKKI